MLTCWGKLEEPPSTAMDFMEAAMDAGFEFGGGAPLLLRHGCRRQTEEDFAVEDFAFGSGGGSRVTIRIKEMRSM